MIYIFLRLLVFLFGIPFLISQTVIDNDKTTKNTNCMPNVVVNGSGETIFEMRTHGESCTFLSLIVPNTGFNFTLDVGLTFTEEPINLGYIIFSFEDTSAEPTTILVDEDAFEVGTFRLRKKGPKLYDRLSTVYDTSKTIYTVFPNGTVMVLPPDNTETFDIPSIENLPVFGTDERILNMKISWGNITTHLDLIFPPEVRFLMPFENDDTTVMTTSTIIPETDATTTSKSVKKRFLDTNWWIVDSGIGIVFLVSGVFVTVLLVYQIIHLVKAKLLIESQSMPTIPSTETFNDPSALTGQQNGASTVHLSTVDPSTATLSGAPSTDAQNPQTTIIMETGEDLVFIAKASKSTVKKKKSNRTD